MRRILLALALMLAPVVARAETCTCASGEAFSVAAVTDAGLWDGCTPSAGDQFTVQSGCAVTITGDFTQDSTAGIGITVQNGGTLDATVASTRFTITLGPNGLVCNEGSTCTLAGKYLVPGTSPTWSSAPSTSSVLAFGDPVPCPGGDCTLMRISYPSGTYNVASGTALDRGIDNAVGAIAAGDILCFWNPSNVDEAATPDVNMCYPVAAASAAGSPYTIDFTVRVNTNLSMPAKQQDIYLGAGADGQLAAAGVKGSRTVTVPAATIGTGEEHYFVGRWIRLEKASGGTYEPFAYRILKAVDGTGANPDTLTLASLDGLRRDYASGDDFAIDYGWRTGDPILVYRPVVLASATADAFFADSPAIFSGTTNIAAAHLVSLEKFELSGAGVPATTVSDVFMQGSEWADSGAVAIRTTNTTSAITLRRVVLVTGGSGAHGFGQYGTAAQNTSIVDSIARYVGDDCIVPTATVAGVLTATRFRCQWHASASQSTQLYDSSSAPLAFRGEGMECVDCASTDVGPCYESLAPPKDGAASLVGTASIDGLLMYGVRTASQKTDWRDGAVTLRNVQIVGGGSTGCTNANYMFPVADRFVLREVAGGASSSYLQNQSIQTTKLDWANGLVVDFAQTSTPGYAIATSTTAATPDRIENVAFVDLLNATASSSVFNLPSSVVDGGKFSRITIAYRPGFTAANGVVRGFHLQDTSPAYTLNKSLFYGLLRTSAYGINVGSSAAYAAPLVRDHNCFFANTNDVAAGVVANLTSDSVRDRPPQFVSQSREWFGGPRGAWNRTEECGATPDAGITRYQWIHAISDLEPESLGTIGSGSGSGGWLPKAF